MYNAMPTTNPAVNVIQIEIVRLGKKSLDFVGKRRSLVNNSSGGDKGASSRSGVELVPIGIF
jgi:hypothetical protein